MHCISCGADNPSEARFCNQCGESLARACPSCGHSVSPGAKFCDQCGTALIKPVVAMPESVAPIHYTPKHLAERILAEQVALQSKGAEIGERKIVTALFADMAGSTALIQNLDPEEVRSLIDPILELMMEAVHYYEGYVAKSLGDGILALFGAPISHEDHPQRALYAALRMQDSMRRYADKVRLEKEVPLQIRVGIHTGEVVVRSIRTEDLHTDYEPVGQSIHLASRMEGIATPGTIVVSESSYRLVEGYFEFKALGAIPIKGITDPITVYEVLGNGPLRTRLQVAARKGLAPFVGRRQELEQISSARKHAKNGHGQIVGVVGEPGVGKSRLFYEYKQRLQQDCMVLETFSVSHGKAFAYLPLIELMKAYLQISPQDDDRRRREKVTGKVLTLDRSLEDGLPYLFYLLGIAEPDSPLIEMDPQMRRQRTFEAVKRLLMRESLVQPLIVIFEDLQWLDNETEAFLNFLVEGLASAPVLLLVNYRPEYQHHWGHRGYFIQLRLDPLGEAEAEELLASLLGNDKSLEPLKQQVMAQTEGNPFFIEEVVQTLAEEQMLSGEVGYYRLAQSPVALHIPATVQGVLAARIDRLSVEEKELLQTLAVIGKEFPLSLVLQVVDLPENDLRQLLSRLQSGEFLYERPAFPEVEYTFKHGLTQEVAYGSMLTLRRNALHERTASAIEDLFSGRLEDRCSELAHHYSCSGNIPKAVEYLKQAGEQAVYRSANAEAADHLQAALKLLKRLPDTPARTQLELELELILGPVWMALKGFASTEVEKTYGRALTLCQQIGTELEQFKILDGLFSYYYVRGDLKTALKQAERLLKIAKDSKDKALLLGAQSEMGVLLFAFGELENARSFLEVVSDQYNPEEHSSLAFHYALDLGVLSLSFLSLILALEGDLVRAMERCDQALSLARQLSHPASLAFALDFAAELHQLRGDAAEVQVSAGSAITLATEKGLAYWISYGNILYGWALTGQEPGNHGIEQMQQGIIGYRATGAELYLTYFLGIRAEALIRAGKIAEAIEVLAEALELVEKTEQRFYEAELYRLKGECLIRQKNLKQEETDGEIENCLKQAMDVSSGQGANLLLWRAMLALAQFRIRQGNIEEARQLLNELRSASYESIEPEIFKSAEAKITRLNQKN
ncbi:adenylate/guanylate cyclase domain-containing protein [Amphritea sp. HPY]|uniref:adenylate/guanylate cyclase domain-containing protein n=1 Tax=Amphritea sp. HPY TaxID=3421652 RepID=UPI003D7E8DBE